MPKIDPAARLSGPGRVPNMLPRFRKPAGGDPVLGDGEFTIQRTDVTLPSYSVPFRFSRSYRSGSQMDGPLGVGWDHNYNQRILGKVLYDPQASGFPTTVGDITDTNCDGTVQWQDGQGGLQVFKAGKSWKVEDDLYLPFTGPNPDITLMHVISGNDLSTSYWQLKYADGTIAKFDRGGFLTNITDPVGNGLSIGWERETAPTAPSSDCVSTGFQSRQCAGWLYGLLSPRIGQRRRVEGVTLESGRSVFYLAQHGLEWVV